MTQPNAPIDFDVLAAEIQAASALWVDLDHAWRVLTATKDIVKAQLVLKQRALQGGSSKNVELVVTASAAWRDYVLAEVTARTAATAAQLALKLAQTRHDGGRSANAARNAEIKHLGG
jgi:hypothetical protein